MNEDDFDVLIPALSPDVEDQLKFCLANEVKLYTTNTRVSIIRQLIYGSIYQWDG